MEEAMKALQISKVGLLVDIDNDEVAAFWERLGWTRRDDLTYYNRVIE
jgi:hypothetical protein